MRHARSCNLVPLNGSENVMICQVTQVTTRGREVGDTNENVEIQSPNVEVLVPKTASSLRVPLLWPTLSLVSAFVV